MKVKAKFKDDKSYCAGFECDTLYDAYELFQCQPDSNFLSSYGMVVIDNDGDAIPAYDANRLWGVTFEVVS